MMEKNRKEVIAKLNKLAKGNKSQWFEDVTWRKENRAWLKKSQTIALKMLRKLRENKQFGVTPCNQVELAKALTVTPQQVNKWVKGKENFTLETISKIENVLGIDLHNTVKSQMLVGTYESLIEQLIYTVRVKSDYTMRTETKMAKVISLHREEKTGVQLKDLAKSA